MQLLRLCFHIYVKSRFYHDAAHIMLYVTFWSGKYIFLSSRKFISIIPFYFLLTHILSVYNLSMCTGADLLHHP